MCNSSTCPNNLTGIGTDNLCYCKSLFGYYRKDGDGHEYLVPEEEIEKFDHEMEILDGFSWEEAIQFGYSPVYDYIEQFRDENIIYSKKILMRS